MNNAALMTLVFIPFTCALVGIGYSWLTLYAQADIELCSHFRAADLLATQHAKNFIYVIITVAIILSLLVYVGFLGVVGFVVGFCLVRRAGSTLIRRVIEDGLNANSV